VVPDYEEVLERSKSLIVHPPYAHPYDQKRIDNPDTTETINEPAQPDRAFVISDDGGPVSEIILELRLFVRYSDHLTGPYSKKADERMTVLAKEP
jgi:hypothetical protein